MNKKQKNISLLKNNYSLFEIFIQLTKHSKEFPSQAKIRHKNKTYLYRSPTPVEFKKLADTLQNIKVNFEDTLHIEIWFGSFNNGIEYVKYHNHILEKTKIPKF
jgi:hypothetical protein